MQLNESMEEMKALLDAIPSKDFKEQPIGYNKREVDEYLDSICDVMANVLEAAQNQQNQPVTKPAMPVVKPAVPSAAPAAADASLQEVLSLAVRLKNEIISEAQAKADTIVADAEKQAQERLGNLSNEQVELQKKVDDLKASIADYKTKFEALLQQQQQAMDAASDLF